MEPEPTTEEQVGGRRGGGQAIRNAEVQYEIVRCKSDCKPGFGSCVKFVQGDDR